MLEYLVNPIIQAGEVNITGFPQQINEKLMLGDMWLAGYVSSLILIILSLLVITIVTKSFVAGIMVSMLMISFCVSIGWMDGWIMIFLCMVVAGLFTFNVLSEWVK